MKKVILILFLISSLFAEDTNLYVKQKKALYIQNMIDLEEKIAFEYERYLLTEFKIPTITDLIKDDFLGTNFSNRNIMGSDIDFKSARNLKIKFALTKNTEDYLIDLYKRDLYRDMTTVVFKLVIKDEEEVNNTSIKKREIDFNKSYVNIELKSPEAKNIHALLLAGKKIEKSCDIDNKINIYCSYNPRTLRWHFANSSWIEYSKSELNKGNVTIKNVDTTVDILKDQAVGSYIYKENGPKYIKLVDNIIMKVE